MPCGSIPVVAKGKVSIPFFSVASRPWLQIPEPISSQPAPTRATCLDGLRQDVLNNILGEGIILTYL